MKKLDEIAKTIVSKEKPVRLPGLKRKREETLEEFLIKFFTKWNQEQPTIYVEKAANGKLKRQAEAKVQTEAGKRRSIGDIYRICLYYYPQCTLQEVRDLLYDNMFKKVPHFRSNICGTIHKRVFYKDPHDRSTQLSMEDQADEYGLTVKSWKQCK